MRLGDSLSSRDTNPVVQHTFLTSPAFRAGTAWDRNPTTQSHWRSLAETGLFQPLFSQLPLCPRLAPFPCTVNRLLLKSCSALQGFQIQNLLDTCKSLFLPPRTLPRPLEWDIVVPFWRLLYTEIHRTGKQRSYYSTEPCSCKCGRRGETRGSTEGDDRGAGSSVMKAINRKDSSKMGNIFFKKSQVGWEMKEKRKQVWNGEQRRQKAVGADGAAG